jgi:hypothetical protein
LVDMYDIKRRHAASKEFWALLGYRLVLLVS